MRGIRSNTVNKINRFLKTAQKEDEELDIDLEELDVDEKPEEEPEEETETTEDESTVGEIKEKVEEMAETLDSVVDALSDQKEVLEDVLYDDAAEEDEEFEEFVEDKDDEEEEDISSAEFGLDDSELVTAEEEIMPNLREKRRARLKAIAAKQRRKAQKTSNDTIADQFELEKSKKNNPKVIDPGVTMGKPEKSVTPDMFKAADLSLEQSEDKSAWTVLDPKDEPIYVIKQGSVPAEEFSSPSFAKQIIRDMQKLGMRRALTKYNAKKYKKEEDKEGCEYEKAKKQSSAELRRRYARALRLATQVMNKNLHKPIPLKQAMFSVLTDIGVPNAARVVEATFELGAEKHFEVAMSLADKYLDMSDEGFIETEAMISDSQIAQISEDEEIQMQASKNSNEMRARASQGSMPFDTATASDPSDFGSRLKDAMPKPKIYSMLKK